MKIKEFVKRYAMYFVLLALCVFFSIVSPVFLTSSNLLNVVRQVSMAGIAAVGVTFVILTGGIDLSIGSAISFENVICAILMAQVGLNPWLVLLIGIGITTLIGLLNGLVVTKIKMPALIVTLATMTIFEGLSYIVSKGVPIYGIPEQFKVLGQGYIGPIPIPVIVMALVFAVGSFTLNKTYFGRYFYAIGGNEEASLLSGLNVTRIKCMVYVLSGFFAGVAGMLMLSRVNSGQPNAGVGFEFDAITGVLLGGVSVSGGSGRLSNVLAGVLILGVLSNGMILLNVNSYAQMVAKGIVLLLAVGFDCVQKSRKSKIVLKTETK